MNIFVILEYREYDDPYFGYNENLDSVYSTFEEAKLSLHTRIARYDGTNGKFKMIFDGMNGNPFLKIIQKMDDEDRKIVFTTTPE